MSEVFTSHAPARHMLDVASTEATHRDTARCPFMGSSEPKWELFPRFLSKVVTRKQVIAEK